MVASPSVITSKFMHGKEIRLETYPGNYEKIIQKIKKHIMSCTHSPDITGGVTLRVVIALDLAGQFDWITQGPDLTTGGQVMGMDPQVNPVSAGNLVVAA